MTISSIALIGLIIASAVCAVYWSVVAVRIVMTMLTLPTGRAGIAFADGEHADAADRPVTVVVPAHNEAGTVPQLVESLRKQDHPRFRALLAL
ncbi:MAG: hypothetical protein AAF235_10660, partial [Planctomycetota bacterium]